MANVTVSIYELFSTPGIPMKHTGLEAVNYQRRKSKD
jgi:hypothetical protein